MYFLIKKLTWADYWMYEAFDLHNYITPGCLNKYPRLDNFYKKMNSMPKLQRAKKNRLEWDPQLLKLVEQSQN